MHNDVLCANDKQFSVFLVLLDLSAAFDTVDHNILLERLFTSFGVKGTAFKWFESYPTDRKFYVSVEGGTSDSYSFNCGVPQNSVLGPVLFLLYTSHIADIIHSHGIDYHLYADDTQLYVSISCSQELDDAKHRLELCANDIDKWMVDNKLKLNGDKAEILVLSAAHCPPPSIESINISGYDISPTSSARNIGVIFDDKLSLEAHITSIYKSCFFHIHNIWKIRRYLSQQSCEILVYAFISSKLDFCNSLLYGLPESSLQKLEYVQNSAARLVTICRKHDHISPVRLD